MKKVGEFWIPDVDLRRLSRFGKTRRKTLERFRNGGTKLEDLEDALSHVGSGRIAVDGGANVGAYSRRLAQNFNTVHAFEPAPDTYAALQRNIEEWKLQKSVILHNQALSNVTENVALQTKRGGRSLSRRISGPGEIPAVTIDSLQLDEVDFIKLDIEGYEYNALLGARDTIERCRPAVLFEDKPGVLRSVDDERSPHQLLQSLGARKIDCIGKGRFDWLYMFDPA